MTSPSADFETWLRPRQPRIPPRAALAVLRLVAAGCTPAFLARYRRGETEGLDELSIRRILEAKEQWDQILSRQAFIIETMERQGRLTPERREQVEACHDADELEDLYLPFKPKRETRAEAAREAGLQPLADWIWACGHGTGSPEPGQTLGIWAYTFRDADRGIPDTEAALRGAREILTERIAELPRLRRLARAAVFGRGHLRVERGRSRRGPGRYQKYVGQSEPIPALRQPQAAHRYLAWRRGAAEGELRLSVGGPPGDEALERELLATFEAAACTVADSPGEALLLEAARAALHEHVLPAIEGEVQRSLKAAADETATEIVRGGLRRLLMEAPFGARPVLGVSLAARAACRAVVVDAAGAPQAALSLRLDAGSREAARQQLGELLASRAVQAVAVGNGPGGRASEAALREALRELGRDVPVLMVSDAGAAAYAASEAGRQELPGRDAGERAAVSIARRLQDPLAELVKMDPKSLAGAQFQHDVPAHLLRRSLDQLIESCVDEVGVDLNLASEALLARVSGLGPALARSVLDRRAALGRFRTRAELLQVPGLTRKACEQAAGFLRVRGGDDPLDETGVHPERYPVLAELAQRLGLERQHLLGEGAQRVNEDPQLREQLGEIALADLARELAAGGRDPRGSFEAFQYRQDVRELSDLAPGMELPGVVTSVTPFGAFVDVGVGQDGLVHVSQLSDRFVEDPTALLRPGMRVSVRVLEVSKEKKRIALTMKTARPVATRALRSERGAGPHAARAGRGRGGGAAVTARPAGRAPASPRSGAASRRPAAHPAPARPAPAAGKPAGAGAGGRFANNPFAVLATLKKDLKGSGR